MSRPRGLTWPGRELDFRRERNALTRRPPYMDASQLDSPERTTADTLCAPPRAMSAGIREACLVHIYPSGASMGRRYTLSTTSSLVIGRSSESSIMIDDNSVSRKHVRIDP